MYHAVPLPLLLHAVPEAAREATCVGNAGPAPVSGALDFMVSSGVSANVIRYYPSISYLKQGIQEFHRKYVIAPADKAANN